MRGQSILETALKRLRRLGVIPRAAVGLHKGQRRVHEALRKAISDDAATQLDVVEADIGVNQTTHMCDHVSEIRRLWTEGVVTEFEFVREYARQCAEHRVPLDTILQAYRGGHSVLSQWMRSAAALNPAQAADIVIAVDDFSIEYINTISTVLTNEHVTHARQLALTESDNRADVLDALLRGNIDPDNRVTSLLKTAGYADVRLCFCVAIARSVAPSEMQNTARAQRIVDAVAAAVTSAKVKALVSIRDNLVVGVFADYRRQSGWTAPRGNLATRIHQHLLSLGPAVLVGISDEQASANLIPKALLEATAAFDCAHFAERVVPFSALSLRRLLLQRGRDHLRVAGPAWMATFIEADKKARYVLSKTLRAYASADMNMLQTARALNVHANTLYARMNRITKITGLNCQRFHALTELLIAADCNHN